MPRLGQRAMIETSEERCDEVERKILELSAARDHLLAALSGLNRQLTRALEYHNSQTVNGGCPPGHVATPGSRRS